MSISYYRQRLVCQGRRPRLNRELSALESYWIRAVYAGKALQSTLRRRLNEHAVRISGRRNIVSNEIFLCSSSENLAK